MLTSTVKSLWFPEELYHSCRGHRTDDLCEVSKSKSFKFYKIFHSIKYDLQKLTNPCWVDEADSSKLWLQVRKVIHKQIWAYAGSFLSTFRYFETFSKFWNKCCHQNKWFIKQCFVVQSWKLCVNAYITCLKNSCYETISNFLRLFSVLFVDLGNFRASRLSSLKVWTPISAKADIVFGA